MAVQGGKYPEIEEWIAEGKFTHKAVLERLNFGPIDELSRNLSHLVNNKTGRVSRDDVVDRIQHVSAPLQDQIDENAANIMYDGLLYLSKAPFPWLQTDQHGLTLVELTRSTDWVTSRYEPWILPSNYSRIRTRADYRRMIFQSLATTLDGKKLPLDIEEWRRFAAENTLDVDSDDQEWSKIDGDWTMSNNDAFGEEMYHDIVDILYATRPSVEELVPTPPRDEYRDLAKGMYRTDLRIYDLSIPRERLTSLVRALMPAQFEEQSWASGVASQSAIELDESADCVVKAFVQKETLGVTWPMFNSAIKNSAPYLLIPLCRIVSQALVGHVSERIKYHVEELLLPTPGSILTQPRLAQLGLLLIRCAEMEYFIRKHYYPSDSMSERLTSSAMIEQLESVGSHAMLLVSGKNDGNKYIFGVYLPPPWSEEKASRCYDQNLPLKAPLLFQLSPFHDAFRGNVEKSEYWSASGEEVIFGQPDKGTSMVLNQGLQRCVFTHHEEDPDEGTYSSTKWRGTWTSHFQIDEIEVWVDERTENDVV